MTNPVPGPPPGARPVPDPTHPDIDRAIADLEAALPDLPLDQHHARMTSVLDVLDGVLDRARQADPPA